MSDTQAILDLVNKIVALGDEKVSDLARDLADRLPAYMVEADRAFQKLEAIEKVLGVSRVARTYTPVTLNPATSQVVCYVVNEVAAPKSTMHRWQLACIDLMYQADPLLLCEEFGVDYSRRTSLYKQLGHTGLVRALKRYIETGRIQLS